MAIESIIIGTRPNDKTGDSLRDGAIKINSNFTELDERINGTLISGSDQISGSFVNITGDTMTGDLTVTGSVNISGTTIVAGNILPSLPGNTSLGSLEYPFAELFISSQSLYIIASNQLDPAVIISNTDGNLEISTGGVKLTEPGNSFIAVTGSFQYLSGSFTHEGSSFTVGDTIVTGSFSISGSTVQIGNTNLIGYIDIVGATTLSGSLTISGSTKMTGSLEITNGIDTIDYVIFDTSPENISAAQGTLQWNIDELTLDLIQNGTTLQVGQEQQYNVTNNSGQPIPDGTCVMASGTTGNSGKILIVPMDGSLNVNAKRFLGITTEEILNGSNGKVTTFGKIRNINTLGQNGETWVDGDVLYIHASIVGALTNIEPVRPNLSMPVAFVINTASNGVLFTRVININKHEFVSVDEDTIIYADLTISGSLTINNMPPISNSGSGMAGEIRTDANYIYVCTATNTWKRSPLTTW